MSSTVDLTRTPLRKITGEYGPRLTGVWHKVVLVAWLAFFVIGLFSLGLSLAAINIWDRVPAASYPSYFPQVDQQTIQLRAGFQAAVMQLGFSLSGFALLLTAVRIIGSLPVFILSAMIVRRYSRQLLVMLFAILLTIIGAAGIWSSSLFSWAKSLVPWMAVPDLVLDALLWFGIILLFVFPDGRFTPRWTIVPAVLLVPLAISLAFGLHIFLNPGTWGDPWDATFNLVFAGIALFAVLYRFTHLGSPQRKQQFRGYTLGTSLLLACYLVLFTLTDVVPAVTGQTLYPTNQALVVFILVSEPLWYLLELVYALGVFDSVIRKKMLEG